MEHLEKVRKKSFEKGKLQYLTSFVESAGCLNLIVNFIIAPVNLTSGYGAQYSATTVDWIVS